MGSSSHRLATGFRTAHRARRGRGEGAADERDRVAGRLQGAGLLFFAFAGYARIATLGEDRRRPAHAGETGTGETGTGEAGTGEAHTPEAGTG